MKKTKKSLNQPQLNKSLLKERQTLKKIKDSLKKTYEEGIQTPDLLKTTRGRKPTD